MKYNRFFKIRFFFLAVFFSCMNLAVSSEQMPDISLPQTNFRSTQQQEPSVENMIAKLKSG